MRELSTTGFVQWHPFPRDDRGATAVEYGLMVGLIAVVIVAAVTAFGIAVNDLSSFRPASSTEPASAT